MKFLSEKDFQNIQSIEQEVKRLVYLKLINIGPNTLDKEKRNPKSLINLFAKIDGYIGLPNDKEELKGEICQMIDKIYGQ